MPNHEPDNEAIDPQVLATIELLESLVGDRTLLAAIPKEVRVKLLSLAGDLYEPDLALRRKLIKDQRRSDKNEKTARHQENLAQAAIRALRAKPVFVTPNVFPPELVEGDEINDDDLTSAAFIETNKEQHCYVRRIQLQQTWRDCRPIRTCCVTHWWPSEDWLPSRNQVVACWISPDCDDSFPTRFSDALCGRSRLC
jgi:hypothetical protein